MHLPKQIHFPILDLSVVPATTTYTAAATATASAAADPLKYAFQSWLPNAPMSINSLNTVQVQDLPGSGAGGASATTYFQQPPAQTITVSTMPSSQGQQTPLGVQVVHAVAQHHQQQQQQRKETKRQVANRLRMREAREAETESARQARLSVDRDRARRTRSNETLEERDRRLR